MTKAFPILHTSGTLSLNFTTSDRFVVKLAGDVDDITFISAPARGSVLVLFLQDEIGGREVNWPGGWVFSNGEPTIANGAGEETFIRMAILDAGTTAYAMDGADRTQFAVELAVMLASGPTIFPDESRAKIDATNIDRETWQTKLGIGGATLAVAEDEPPSYFIARGVGQWDEDVDTVAIGAMGNSDRGNLNTKVKLVSGDYRVIQRFTPYNGEQGQIRSNVNTTTWRDWNWVLQGGQATVADLADAGNVAVLDVYDPEAQTGDVPTIDGENHFTNVNYFEGTGTAFFRDIVTVAAAVGRCWHQAVNTDGDPVIYAETSGQIVDATAGSEDGAWRCVTVVAGAAGFRFGAGQGLYTAGATDNGSGTVSSLRQYLVPAAAPSSPASGWALYCDSGDGNKLKAKASTGTVVTIAAP